LIRISAYIFSTTRSDHLVHRLEAEKPENIALCSIVKAELVYGSLKSGNPRKNLEILDDFFKRFKSYAFDDTAADHYGRIRTELEKSGVPIGPNDLCIAAIASANNLTLITHNTKEYERVEGLKWED
jgi:tRNA(fMet)-specific endonuclease VapC